MMFDLVCFSSSTTKKFTPKKCYSICLVATWIIITFALLHYLSTATIILNIKAMDFSSAATRREQFHHVTSSFEGQKTFVSLLDNCIHIYSALTYISTTAEKIYVIGWENTPWEMLFNPELNCCLIYGPNGNDIISANLLEKQYWEYLSLALLSVKQYVCPNVLRELNRVPKAVSLGMNNTCPKNHSQYLIVDYPKRQKDDTVAVCAKIIYENISASALIEWFEYQKMIGVNKVMLYTYNLNTNATSVIKYYKSSGFCEAFPFMIPPLWYQERGVGMKDVQGWSDEQLTVYDCQAKLSGYQYITLYDVDEFIYTNVTNSLPKLLTKLNGLYPIAAGFTFKTEIYATTWGRDNDSAVIRNLTIGSYTMRTEASSDRVKSIVRTSRIEPGDLVTHDFWPKRPYMKSYISESLATIKHYRACRPEWLRNDGEQCYKTIEKFRDISMLPVAAKLNGRVNAVKETLSII